MHVLYQPCFLCKMLVFSHELHALKQCAIMLAVLHAGTGLPSLRYLHKQHTELLWTESPCIIICYTALLLRLAAHPSHLFGGYFRFFAFVSMSFYIANVLCLYRFELMWQQPDTRKLVLWGGTCMALTPQGFHPQSWGCLVGSEGGAVFRCSLDGSRAALQAFAQVLTMCTVKPLKSSHTSCGSLGGLKQQCKSA